MNYTRQNAARLWRELRGGKSPGQFLTLAVRLAAGRPKQVFAASSVLGFQAPASLDQRCVQGRYSFVKANRLTHRGVPAHELRAPLRPILTALAAQGGVLRGV